MAEKLGELLVRKGIVTQKVVDETLKAQLIYGGRLGTLLVELGHVDVDQLGQLLAEQRRFPLAEKKNFESATDFSVMLITPDIAAKHLAFPFAQEGRKLKVAFAAPYDANAVDAVAFATGMRVVPYIAPEMRLRFYIERRFHVTFEAKFIRLAPEAPPPVLRAGSPAPVTGPAAVQNEDDLEEAETFEEMPEDQYLMDQDEDPSNLTGMGAAAYLAMTEAKSKPQAPGLPKITAAVDAPQVAPAPPPPPPPPVDLRPPTPAADFDFQVEEEVPEEWAGGASAGPAQATPAARMTPPPVSGPAAVAPPPPAARMTPAPMPAITPVVPPGPRTTPVPAPLPPMPPAGEAAAPEANAAHAKAPGAPGPAARMTPAPMPAIAPVAVTAPAAASTPAARMTPPPIPAAAHVAAPPAALPTPAAKVAPPAPIPVVPPVTNGAGSSHAVDGDWASALSEHRGAASPPAPPAAATTTLTPPAAAETDAVSAMTPPPIPGGPPTTQPPAAAMAPVPSPEPHPPPGSPPPLPGAPVPPVAGSAQRRSGPHPALGSPPPPPNSPVPPAANPAQRRSGPHPSPVGHPPPPMPMPMPMPGPMPPGVTASRPMPGPPPPGWRPLPPGAPPPLAFPPPGAVWRASPGAVRPQPPAQLPTNGGPPPPPPPPPALEEAAPPPTAPAPTDPEPTPAYVPPPRPRVLELETSGDDVPPLMSAWEMLSSEPEPTGSPEPSPLAPAPDQDLELAAPWEFVGYQGDAAEDLQKSPAQPPAPSPPPPGASTTLSEPTDPEERPPDPETAAQIADAVAKGELDWSTVIAFDGEQPTPEADEDQAPRAAASTEEMETALEEAASAMKSATQAAMIGEALLAYSQRGFGRAFFFIVQYGVAIFWRGFGPGSDGAVVAFRPDLKEPSMFKTAMDSGKPSVVTVPESSIDENFFWAISPPPPAYVVAVPVRADGAAREILCVVGDEPGPSPGVLDALERLSACAAEAHARLSGKP